MLIFLSISLALVCALGLAAAWRVASAEGWMTAGRTLPSWVLAASWISAEFSAMTMLGVPAAAYRADWSLLQFFFGSALARLVIAFIVLRRLYGKDPNLYAFLDERFGRITRAVASISFISARTLSASVRLMAVAAIAASFFETKETAWIVAFAAASVVALAGGGVRAAVWTGCLQAIAIVGGGLVVLWFLAGSFEGGVAEALRVAGNAGRLSVWHWSAPAAILTGFFGSLAAFGTDQETMQRLFAARSRLTAQRAVIFAAAAAAAVLMLFLAVGTGLFVFYEQRTALALPAAADSVMPHFAFQALPFWRRAILLAAFVLASIDLPLVGLTTVFPGPGTGGAKGLNRLRFGSIVWGVALAAIACIFANNPGGLWAAFKIGGVVYGPLLGVFAYGFFGPRRSDSAAALSLVLTALICAWALWSIESGVLAVEWRWLPVFGAGAAAVLTHGFSLIFQNDQTDPR